MLVLDLLPVADLTLVDAKGETALRVRARPRLEDHRRALLTVVGERNQKCNNGLLIPLSDYGQEGASVIFKAWACTNPECGFSLRVDKGEVSYGKKIEHKH